MPGSGQRLSAVLLSVHADNEAAQTAAGVTTSSGTQFCRQCNATKQEMYSYPEYVPPILHARARVIICLGFTRLLFFSCIYLFCVDVLSR